MFHHGRFNYLSCVFHFFLSVCAYTCLSVHMCTVCAGARKRVLDLLEPEFQAAVSHHMITQVLRTVKALKHGANSPAA